MKSSILCAAVLCATMAMSANATVFIDSDHVEFSGGNIPFTLYGKYSLQVSRTEAAQPSDYVTDILTTAYNPFFGTLKLTEGPISPFMDIFEVTAGEVFSKSFLDTHVEATSWYENPTPGNKFFLGIATGTDMSTRNAFGWAQFEVDQYHQLKMIHNFMNYGGGVTIGSVEVVSVPEPTSIALLFAGLGMMGVARKRATV